MEFCCWEMKEAVGWKDITYDEEYNTYYAASGFEQSHEAEEGLRGMYEISYCPFCGERLTQHMYYPVWLFKGDIRAIGSVPVPFRKGLLDTEVTIWYNGETLKAVRTRGGAYYVKAQDL